MDEPTLKYIKGYFLDDLARHPFSQPQNRQTGPITNSLHTTQQGYPQQQQQSEQQYPLQGYPPQRRLRSSTRRRTTTPIQRSTSVWDIPNSSRAFRNSSPIEYSAPYGAGLPQQGYPQQYPQGYPQQQHYPPQGYPQRPGYGTLPPQQGYGTQAPVLSYYATGSPALSAQELGRDV
ncbi:uncharacterized protein EV422DRAFT_568815 [Fimicolochytrium jonesii]|uniref:uncharacterized protein n=1 Tax=Fimicolochytrium jonesii TaxID=1396493 RepID=UPI0022FDF10E|nr:uncharacterized protein EV422DRAFT_568815 [Fimicolochytrium jonesii]KAI8819383.1 hypothetical protein EV422DRAFT_568815 [Fimicolochytrium jonesii]